MTSITHNLLPAYFKLFYLLIQGVCSGGYFIYSIIFYVVLLYLSEIIFLYTNMIAFHIFLKLNKLLYYLHIKIIVKPYCYSHLRNILPHHFNKLIFEKKIFTALLRHSSGALKLFVTSHAT